MNVEYNKNEKGMTLIEVMAALVLLSLLAVTILSIFPTTAYWIKGAGKQTIAVQYANSITDAIRADSTGLSAAGSEYRDNNDDGSFNFELGSSAIAVDAPLDSLKANMTVNITPHDDSAYYDSALTNKPFRDNLFEITVTIEWEEGGGARSFEVSTIMGAQ